MKISWVTNFDLLASFAYIMKFTTGSDVSFCLNAFSYSLLNVSVVSWKGTFVTFDGFPMRQDIALFWFVYNVFKVNCENHKNRCPADHAAILSMLVAEGAAFSVWLVGALVMLLHSPLLFFYLVSFFITSYIKFILSQYPGQPVPVFTCVICTRSLFRTFARIFRASPCTLPRSPSSIVIIPQCIDNGHPTRSMQQRCRCRCRRLVELPPGAIYHVRYRLSFFCSVKEVRFF